MLLAGLFSWLKAGDDLFLWRIVVESFVESVREILLHFTNLLPLLTLLGDLLLGLIWLWPFLIVFWLFDCWLAFSLLLLIKYLKLRFEVLVELLGYGD